MSGDLGTASDPRRDALDAALWAIGEGPDLAVTSRDEAALALGQSALLASQRRPGWGKGGSTGAGAGGVGRRARSGWADLGGLAGLSTVPWVAAQAVWGGVRWWQVWMG